MGTYKLMSFDQSSSHSGYALFNDSALDIHGHIKTPYRLSGYQACQYQAEAIFKLLDYCRPDEVIVEGLYMPRSANPQTIFMLGRLYEMIAQACARTGVTLMRELKPATMTAFMGLPARCRRDAKKRTARQFAATLIYKDRSQWQQVEENEADAIVIGATALGIDRSLWA